MRRLVYYIAVSLDGYISGPDGQTDAFAHEGDHMAWLIEHYPETIPGHVRGPLGLAETEHRAFDTVVLGRDTHQVAVDAGLASGYPHLRQLVVTHHPDDLPAEPGLTTTDDPVAAVRALKAENSRLDVWLCGGGALAGQLLGEIDEVRLKVNPVILGAGRPLIAGGYAPRALVPRLRREFESGVVYAEYAIPA